MNAHVTLQARVEQYLAERRHAGFKLSTMGHGLKRFAHYVDQIDHHGPLTVDLMTAWASQAKGGNGDRATWAVAVRDKPRLYVTAVEPSGSQWWGPRTPCSADRGSTCRWRRSANWRSRR